MAATSFFLYPQNILFFLIAFTNIFIGIYLYGKYKFSTNTYFLLIYSSIFLWCFGIGMRSSIIGIEEKLFWTKIAYIGIVTTPIALLLAMRSLYLKRQLLKSQWLGFLLSAFAILVLVFTDDQHHLFWNITPNTPNQWNYLHYTGGMVYWLNTGYQFIIGIAIILILLKAQKNPLHQANSRVFLFSILPPIFTNLLFSLGITILPDYNIAPIGFLFTGPIMAYGLRKIKHADISVLGIEQYLKDMRQGLVISDIEGRVQIINPFAQRILDLEVGDILGDSELIATALVFNGSRQENDKPYQFEILIYDELYYIELRTLPIKHVDGLSIGNLILLNNITDEKKIANVARISQIHKIKAEERERLAKELQDRIVQDLYALRLQMGTAKNHARDGILGRTYDDIEDSTSMIDQLVKKVNLLYYELDDDSFGKIGLIKALQDQIEIQKYQSNISIDLVNFDKVELTVESQRTIYGIIVGVLNEILKLSKPISIAINISDASKNFMIKFIISERRFQPGLLTKERVETKFIELLETIKNINGEFEFSIFNEEQKLINIQLPRK